MTTPTSTPSRATLLLHQQVAHDFIVANPACAVWLGVGAAKTKTALTALQTLRPPGHTLVVAPLQIARNSWTDEIAKWGFSVRVRSLTDGVAKRRTKRNPDGIRRLTTHERHALYAELRDPGTPPAIWVASLSLLDELVQAMGFLDPCGPEDYITPAPTAHWPFPTVILDEAQEFKNGRSNRFQTLFQVRLSVKRIIELTGTPSPQNLLDLWSQMALLDGGRALGPSYAEFRENYFDPDKYVDNQPVSWRLKPGADKHIHAAVAHLVVSVENNSVVKPPTPRIGTYHVGLDPETKERYLQFVRDRVLELAPDTKTGEVPVIAADTAAHLRAVLMQFASGTVYNGPNHRVDFEIIHAAKFEALLTILRATATPVMVAYRFQADETRLLAQLPEHGFAVEKFNGNPDMVRRWNDRQIPVLLLQPASSGRGLNLQYGSHTIVWYTLPDSSEQWTQTNGRLVRIGQTSTVDIVRLVTAGTVDTLQIPRLENKLTTQQDLLEAVRDIIAGP